MDNSSVDSATSDETSPQGSDTQTQRHLAEITLLNQVMSLTAMAQDLPTALQQACAILAQYFGAPQGAVAIFDDDQTFLDVIAEYQEDDLPSALGTQIPGIGNPSMDYILSDKAPLAINDAQTNPLLAPVHDLMLRRNTHSLLLVPILLGEDVHGTLGLDFHVRRTFTPDELQLAQNVANQLGQVLQRLTLFTQQMEHARLATHLSNLGEQLNRSFTLESVFSAIGEGAAALSGADRCAVFTHPADAPIRCAWSQGVSQPVIEAMLHGLNGSAALSLLESTEPTFLRNIDRMPADALIRRLGELEGYRSVAIWPLVYENRTVAAVICYYNISRNWSALEREMMSAFSRQATSTLENARLFGEAQRRAAELERLSQISLALRSARDGAEIQTVILDEVLNLLGAPNGAVFLRDVTTKQLRVADVRGSALTVRRARLDLASTLTAAIVQSGRPFVSTDLRTHALFSHSEFNHSDLFDSPVAAVCAPMIVEDLNVGALWVARDRPFSDADVNLILAVADISAGAIHRAQVVETLEQRVHERTQALAEANARLTELDTLKSKFVSDVSHELRTPIQNLKMYLDLLERGRPEKRSIYLSTLQDQVELLQRLTEDILDLSRVEMSPEAQKQPAVDVNSLIQQVYRALQPSAEATGLHVSLHLDPTLPTISADPDRLVQVINNLVSNAINYTPAGFITIQTRCVDGSVCVAVQDSGMGIAANDMPHLFDRFYRSSRVSQSNIRGTGLGLAIVHEIVQQHQGRIEVESEEGKGSCFRVWLPVLSD